VIAATSQPGVDRRDRTETGAADPQPQPGAAAVLVVRAARQIELDAVGVLRHLPAAKADEEQGAIAPPGQRLGDGLDRGTQPVEHQGRLLVDRPAARPFDAGEGGRYPSRRGRRRVARPTKNVSPGTTLLRPIAWITTRDGSGAVTDRTIAFNDDA
jgi:hypothetical protein